MAWHQKRFEGQRSRDKRVTYAQAEKESACYETRALARADPHAAVGVAA
jgi:hypothetical protein